MAFQSYPDYKEILRQPGFLFWGATDLSNEAGWGTKLGFCVGGIKFDPGYKVINLYGMEHGEEPEKRIFLGCEPVLKASLRNYNATALSVLFPGLASGAAVKYPNTLKPGMDIASSHGNYLLFVPEDQANNKVLLLQKAVPNIVAAFEFSRQNDTVFQAVFVGFRKTDDADGVYYFGDLSGAVLR